MTKNAFSLAADRSASRTRLPARWARAGISAGIVLGLGVGLWAQSPQSAEIPVALTGGEALRIPLMVEMMPDQPGKNIEWYRKFGQRRPGDAARGRVLFNDPQRLACARCHSVDGSASKAGPDFAALGDKFGRVDIIEAILLPSASIAVGYDTTVLETNSGQVEAGVVKQATDAWVELMGIDAEPKRIRNADIKTRHTSAASLMPEGLYIGLTIQEFADLAEYLVSLKQPASAAMVTHGMPATIEPLAQAVQLRPFFDEKLRFPYTTKQDPGGVRAGLVWFGQIPGRENSFLVVHQSGKIWRLEKESEDDTKNLFLDLSADVYSAAGPCGLLSIAFHPHFQENRRYFLKHQVMNEGKLSTIVIERQATADGLRDSGRSSRHLISFSAATVDHTGGCLVFGPDGFLYIGMGDTGPQGDPQGHGQDLSTFQGKMLRIDVDHTPAGASYAIPADNPFRNVAHARPEIWALGLREPWRYSFDALTGDLWVGDVGQDQLEEVDIVRRGENYGWNVFEGFEPFSNSYRQAHADYRWPVMAYNRQQGSSVTGGFVYRGDPKSSFYGVYICGDYVSKRIWGVTQEQGALKTMRELAVAPESVVSFGTDEKGNIYVVGYEGMIFKMDFGSAHFN